VLPTARPVSAQNMNYAVVAIGGVLLLVGVMWLAWGRRTFRGAVATVTIGGEDSHMGMGGLAGDGEKYSGDEKSAV